MSNEYHLTIEPDAWRNIMVDTAGGNSEIWLPLAVEPRCDSAPIITVLRPVDGKTSVEPVGVELGDGQWVECHSEIIRLDESGNELDQPYLRWHVVAEGGPHVDN